MAGGSSASGNEVDHCFIGTVVMAPSGKPALRWGKLNKLESYGIDLIWLPVRDSNPDMLLQRQLSYR